MIKKSSSLEKNKNNRKVFFSFQHVSGKLSCSTFTFWETEPILIIDISIPQLTAQECFSYHVITIFLSINIFTPFFLWQNTSTCSILCEHFSLLLVSMILYKVFCLLHRIPPTSSVLFFLENGMWRHHQEFQFVANNGTTRKDLDEAQNIYCHSHQHNAIKKRLKHLFIAFDKKFLWYDDENFSSWLDFSFHHVRTNIRIHWN